ncbi:hypothetical protein [Bradyrhizobium sp. 170]|uniref:hypothetical protein n=1 Tax=Bradyrhizobium sp. 170 TaxID=2782641 RepID=UPI001FFF647F|nr:hypothetical protein [Bradyrhizobium sp. 170]UPK00777.1 hypothetical protein IVB05_23970 [Bradyrhizobium sp. 170]
MIRFVDRLPYALVVAICAAVAPLLVMLPFATTEVRPLVVVPGMGLVLGFFAAIIILWSKKLRWSATTGEMMSAIRAEGGADSGAISLSLRENHEVENGSYWTRAVSFSDFYFLNRPQITRMLMIDWLTGILGWSVAFLLFSRPSFALTVTLAGLLAVHIARIAWLIRQHNLLLTLYQSTVTIVVGGTAGVTIVLLAYVGSTLDLIGSWPVYRHVSLALLLLLVFFVFVDIAIASILRKLLR